MKNKIVRHIFIFSALSTLLLGCQEREVESFDLSDKRGIAYYKDESEPFSGKAVSKFVSSAQVKSVTHYENGVKDGVMRILYDSGVKKLEAEFQEGDIVSLRSWSKSGEVLRKLNTKDGLLHGSVQWGSQSDEGIRYITSMKYVEGSPHGESITRKIKSDGTDIVIGKRIYDSGYITYVETNDSDSSYYDSEGELQILDEPREFIKTTQYEINGDDVTQKTSQYDVENDQTISFEREKELVDINYYSEIHGELLVENQSIKSLINPNIYVYYSRNDDGGYDIRSLTDSARSFSVEVTPDGDVLYDSCDIDDDNYYKHYQCEARLGSIEKAIEKRPGMLLAVKLTTQ